MSPPEQPQPSYEELAGLVVDLTSQLEWAHGRIVELEARLAAGGGVPPAAVWLVTDDHENRPQERQ